METQRAVLVLTGADDPTAGAVVAELDRRGVPVTVMDTGDFPTSPPTPEGGAALA